MKNSKGVNNNNNNMTVIPVVIGTLKTVLKSLENRLGEVNSRERTEVIQNTAEGFDIYVRERLPNISS